MTGARFGMPGEDDAIPLEETPFRVALLGDWSGRGARGGRMPLRHRAPVRVDRDDFDAVLAAFRPVLELPVGESGAALAIGFSALDDFHPDQLYQRLPVFAAFRDLRGRLSDSATFPAARAELTGETPPSVARAAPSSGLLDSILDEAVPPSAGEALAESGGDLHNFIQRVMRPHLVANPDPRQGELVAQVDAAAAATLRAILHAPAFQAFESLWRALDLLVRNIDTSSELQLHLVDLTSSELAEALPPGGDPMASPLHQLLARGAEDGPWALLAGGFSSGGSPEEVERLAQLAAIGQRLGAPWIGSAEPSLAGADAEPPAWAAFRGSALARHAGLAFPRFLLREPYGKAGEACERLPFEEFEGPPEAERLPWGSPAFAVALILARGFAERGWQLIRGLDPEISGLPMVVWGKGAEARAIPVAEVLLTERAADAMMERGIMPLATLKDQDRARLVRLQSVAHPIAALAGRWTA